MPDVASRALLIKLFLASPGDVVDVRAEAREVVKRVNRTLGRRLGCVIDVYGWEDRPPAYGRPQQQINADVDAADVVVGLLRRRWGSPTGTHSSGFAEEFGRTMDRRRATGLPGVLLFFLHAPDGRDRQVSELSSQLIADEEILFKDLAEGERFSDVFHDALTEHVVDLSLRELQNPPVPDTQRPARPVVTGEVELARHLLARAISQLPDKQKIAVTLVQYEGMQLREVAQVMGVAPDTARRWYRTAMQDLATRMGSAT